MNAAQIAESGGERPLLTAPMRWFTEKGLSRHSAEEKHDHKKSAAEKIRRAVRPVRIFSYLSNVMNLIW